MALLYSKKGILFSTFYILIKLNKKEEKDSSMKESDFYYY